MEAIPTTKKCFKIIDPISPNASKQLRTFNKCISRTSKRPQLWKCKIIFVVSKILFLKYNSVFHLKNSFLKS